MSKRSKWGDPRDNQIRASAHHDLKEKVRGLLLTRTVYSSVHLDTDKGDEVPDDIEAERTFLFRCGLIEAINAFSGERSRITFYLDGYPNLSIAIENTSFKFDLSVGDEPVAEVKFSGVGTRRGKFKWGRSDDFVTITFGDKEQIGYFVSYIPALGDPERTHRRRSSGIMSQNIGW